MTNRPGNDGSPYDRLVKPRRGSRLVAIFAGLCAVAACVAIAKAR